MRDPCCGSDLAGCSCPPALGRRPARVPAEDSNCDVWIAAQQALAAPPHAPERGGGGARVARRLLVGVCSSACWPHKPAA